MNKFQKVIVFTAILIGIMYVGFYTWFSIGMRNANRSHPITNEFSKEYRSSLNRNYKYIQNINIYYKQGRVYFDFTIGQEMTLEECKQIVKEIKEMLQNKERLGLFINEHYTQSTIVIWFDNKKDSYSFMSTYLVQRDDVKYDQDKTEINNYKVWYMSVNNQPRVRLEF